MALDDNVAIYAAIIATISLGWKIYTDLLDRPRIKVTVAIHSSPFDFHISGPTPEALIQNYPPAINKPFYVGVKAVNEGRRPITVVAGGLYLSDRTATPVIDFVRHLELLPKKLNEGEDCTVYADLKGFASTLEHSGFRGGKLRAWVRDATGHRYWSRVPDETRKTSLSS